MLSDPQDQKLVLPALEQFHGKGYLRCQHNTRWDCDFTIIRLLNGRLQVRAVPDVKHGSSQRWNEWLTRCEPFALEGQDDTGIQLSAETIRFTRTNLSLADFRHTLVGYAQSATRRRGKEPGGGPVAIKCELSNFRVGSIIYPVKIQIDDYSLEVGRLTWPGWAEIDEHSNAYQHATISSYVLIEDISVEEQDKAIECLHRIGSLLSIAGRGHVFCAARHRFDAEERWSDSQFSEPVFTARGWLRPLIPARALGEFLTAAYPHLSTRYQSLELGGVIDHYLQALTLHSVWPLSLGIFTAMETLKAAFLRPAEKSEAQFWIVPADFDANKSALDDLIAVLASHFRGFDNLSSAEKESLKVQLRALNRRSYKYQLQIMLDQLGVSYSRKELQAFIDIRNRIIHQGVPIPGDIPADEYEHGTTQGWRRIQAAASLFERALLAVLSYTGLCELFDAPEEAERNG